MFSNQFLTAKISPVRTVSAVLATYPASVEDNRGEPIIDETSSHLQDGEREIYHMQTRKEDEYQVRAKYIH